MRNLKAACRKFMVDVRRYGRMRRVDFYLYSCVECRRRKWKLLPDLRSYTHARTPKFFDYQSLKTMLGMLNGLRELPDCPICIVEWYGVGIMYSSHRGRFISQIIEQRAMEKRRCL